MYALKAPTCPRDKTSSTYPFQSCKELSPQFCIVFLMRATSSMLGRSPVDGCDQCQFKFPYWALFWGQFWEQFWAPFLGATIRIERTGAKTEAKTGPKSKAEPISQNCSRIFSGMRRIVVRNGVAQVLQLSPFSCSRASLHAFCDGQFKLSSQLLEKERAQA